MLTHWNKLLTTDCEVVKIKNEYIYPIFKNGSTTLRNNAEKVYKNNELKKLKEITVYIRNAKDRFTSGINTYAELNNKEIKTIIKQISNNKLCNRHFAPQFIWLFHLYKYFRGTINLKPLEQLQLEKEQLAQKETEDVRDKTVEMQKAELDAQIEREKMDSGERVEDTKAAIDLQELEMRNKRDAEKNYTELVKTVRKSREQE